MRNALIAISIGVVILMTVMFVISSNNAHEFAPGDTTENEEVEA